MFLKFIKKYPIVIMVLIFMVLCYMKNKEAFTNMNLNLFTNMELDLKTIPPSSIGPGYLCPMNKVYENKFPPCMNGFYCKNETFPDDDDIGVCRLNTNWFQYMAFS